MKLERINTAKGFCAKRSLRIPELHRNNINGLKIYFLCDIAKFFAPASIVNITKPNFLYN